MSSSYRVINPEELGAPSGWNNGMLAAPGGSVLFIAGQTARGASGRVEPVGFVEQFGRALDNILVVLRDAGGTPVDVGRMTIYVTDLDAYLDSLRELGGVYRERMGRHYPAMALVEVSRLVDPAALVEIEATAVLPMPVDLTDRGGHAQLV